MDRQVVEFEYNCSLCGKPINHPTSRITCSTCNAFWFCSTKHLKHHSTDQCNTAQHYMTHLTIPHPIFPWYPSQPHPSHCTILHNLNVHLKGPFARECHCINSTMTTPFGQHAPLLQSYWKNNKSSKQTQYCSRDEILKELDEWWGIDGMSMFLSIPPSTTTNNANDNNITTTITDWSSYIHSQRYTHNASTSSPLPLCLHSPLTVYRAIQRLYQLRNTTNDNNNNDNTIVVCLVGVEKEIDQWPIFLELGCLLPHINIVLLFIGTEVPHWMHDCKLIVSHCVDDNNNDNSRQNNKSTTFHFIQGVFDDYFNPIVVNDNDNINRVNINTTNNSIIPDVVVGLHAGLGAYQTWQTGFQSIQSMIHRYNKPEVMLFTDYITQSVDISKSILYSMFIDNTNTDNTNANNTNNTLYSLSDVQVNPFYKPDSVHQSTHAMPYAQNGFEVWLEYNHHHHGNTAMNNNK